MEDELISRMAKRLKVLRKERGLTLQVLSERSHVSRGLLSKIENSRTIPSLPVFFGIIKSMNVSAKEFFEDVLVMQGKDYLLFRQKDYQEIEKEDRIGFDYRFILGQAIQECMMEIVLLTVKPHAKRKSTTTDGFEFKYIISGQCHYAINNETILLQEGDSIYFDASKPHFPVNDFSESVKILVIYFLKAK